MLLEALKIAAGLLWLAICFRFYTLIARRNIGQRRLIALAAGLGAGLVYVAANMMIGVLKPRASIHPPTAQQAQNVRINSK